MALVPVELTRVMLVETSDQQVIVLEEREGSRSFPIVVGIFEAVAIHRQLRGEELPRPMTHDLLLSVIESMGGRLEKIVVNDLSEGTFYGQLYIRMDGETKVVDTRPSDALALAVRTNCGIFVDDVVFERLNEQPEQPD